MRINTNVSAMTTLRYLNQATDAKSKALTELSSGSRINSASDDAAGLAVSEKMKAQIGGIEQAENNAQDGVSLVQTAEGEMSETQSILDRMRDLAVESANGTLTSSDRSSINDEFSQLTDEINRLAGSTTFNTQNLVSGTTTNTFTFQIGANTQADNRITVTISAMGTTALGINSISILSAGSAVKAISAIDGALDKVSGARATLGAVENRLSYAISNLETSDENTSEANSRIRDVDMAQEMTEYTKENILTQAATTMLSQANSMPSTALTLLQNL
ncbi:flagellin [Liquorilactobacillus vini]|uniref:Flagellin n=3 Tax=Liquorilactobacillus vini TaxID=238015 RepID=A0A0A7RMF6_9LACO|nr:flagellin [Liquorilactobacillus vini]AJA34468.1 flagellin [Liquorilactobacillus vini DSM 20605]